jgi:hypothetical protein
LLFRGDINHSKPRTVSITFIPRDRVSGIAHISSKQVRLKGSSGQLVLKRCDQNEDERYSHKNFKEGPAILA